MAMARSWADVRAQARATGKLDDVRVAALGGEIEIVAKFGDERSTVG